MRAYQISAFDAPPRLTTLPRPTPAAGQVLLRIEACGLNFADTLMVQGRYQDMPDLPFVPGLELCGIVAACGAGVELPEGTRVAVYAGHGGLAEWGVFDAALCRPVPDGMPATTAAGFMVAYGTSHLALTRRARLRAGETLAVFGAAGGVGLTAVEIGKALGARVIAVARGAEKCAIARAAGADHVLEASADLKAELRALGGVDVVYDPVGGDAFTAALGAMRREGRILVIGFASGSVPPVPANHVMVKNVDIIGFYWGGYRQFAPKALTDSLDELMRWYAQGRLAPHISHVLPLDQVEAGLDLLRNRQATGKVVIQMPLG